MIHTVRTLEDRVSQGRYRDKILLGRGGVVGGARDIGSSPKVGYICTVTRTEYGVLYFPLARACCILEGVLLGGLF